MIRITQKWHCLVHLGNPSNHRTTLLYYRRRAPGEQDAFRFAVVAPGATTGTTPTRSQLRVALGRLVPLVYGTLGREIARQCGATINTYPLRAKKIYGPDRLSETAVVTIGD